MKKKKVGLRRINGFVQNKKVDLEAFLSTLQVDGSKLLAFTYMIFLDIGIL